MKNQTVLETIEEKAFKMGNREYTVHEKTGSLAALRGAVTAYRASMQAMRYKIMYNAVGEKLEKKIKSK